MANEEASQGILDSPSPVPIGSPETPNPSSPDDVQANLDESLDQAAEDTKTRGGTAGKIFSKAWNDYNIVHVKGERKAQCKSCKRLLVGDPKQCTSHLRNHQLRCREKKTRDIRQQILQANFGKEKHELAPFNFDKDVSRKELAKMIIIHEYPLMMVEHGRFRSFCNTLNPLFQVVSRNTIKSDCMKIYEVEKNVTLQMLEKNNGRVAVTTDMWTSSFQKKGFMAVTAHYIDNNWMLQSRIIRFMYVPSPHTSDVLYEALLECFIDWNIDRKISAITVDNCSTNDAMMNSLIEKLPSDTLLIGGKLIHMRCCAHILNLIVKDGLDVIESAIGNIRDSVAYWSGTQKRWEKFEETARRENVTITKKLGLDCKTRWNSTFLMLQTALDYKDIFSRLKVRDAKYKCAPSESEWNMTKQICGKLKLFYDATELFSGTNYPTANLYFPNVCEIKLAIVEWSASNVEVIGKMAKNMMEKFDKYWLHVHGIMAVATILDPRYKCDLLEYYFEQIYKDNADYEKDNILVLCRELFEQYEKEYQGRESDKGCSSGSVDANHFQVGVNVKSLSAFDLFTSKKKRKPVRSELDLYLEEDILPRTVDFDVLTWWKSNKGKYPILSCIAKDILAIPVSTVASESAFSTSGRLIGPHRSRLHPKTVEALMCAQSWLSAEKKGEYAKGTVFYDSDDDKNEIME